MKVLSLLQPWASLVVLGHKKIETRSWDTKHRGELLIHASKKKIRVDENTQALLDHLCEIPGFMEDYDQLPYGAIIGKVNLIDTIPTAIFQAPCIQELRRANIGGSTVEFPEQEEAFGDYSPNRFGWLLSDPVLFKEPIPCKGQLSIWNLPAELEASIIQLNAIVP